MATTGEKLVELSNISSGTALEHLLNITTGGGINDPTIYALDIVNTSGVGLNDGSITMHVSAGTTPYEYKINDIPYQSSNVFNNLGEGTFTLTIRDYSGYTDSIQGIKLFAPADTPIISELIIIDASDTISADGSIKIIANGGDEPYTYSLNGSTYQSENIFMGLRYGIFEVSVKDNNGVVNTLSGIKVGAKASPSGGGYGGGRNIHINRAKVNVKNIKIKDEEKKKIKVKVNI